VKYILAQVGRAAVETVYASCMPAAVRADTSEVNLTQHFFYSSRLSRAATDTYGKRENTMKTHQTKAFRWNTDPHNGLVARCFGDWSLMPLAEYDVWDRVKPQPLL